MLDTVSNHHESINKSIRNFAQHHRDLPALNYRLFKLLARESATKTGTKRSTRPDVEEESRKRTKTSNGHSAASYGPYYPDLPSSRGFSLHVLGDVYEQPDQRVPVMTHTLDIAFDGENDPAFLEELERQRVNNGKTALQVMTSPSEFVALTAAQAFAQVTGRPAAVIVHVDVGTQVSMRQFKCN